MLPGCAVPKAVVVEDPNKLPASSESPPGNATPNAPPDDGLRTGNLVTLPSDSDFRTGRPALRKSSPDAGTVIAHPPTVPVPKPKPDGKPKE